MTMSFPLSSPRFSSGSALSSVFHSINPSTFKKQKKVPSALAEVRWARDSWGQGQASRPSQGKDCFSLQGQRLLPYPALKTRLSLGATDEVPWWLGGT